MERGNLTKSGTFKSAKASRNKGGYEDLWSWDETVPLSVRIPIASSTQSPGMGLSPLQSLAAKLAVDETPSPFTVNPVPSISVAHLKAEYESWAPHSADSNTYIPLWFSYPFPYQMTDDIISGPLQRSDSSLSQIRDSQI